MGEKLDNDGSDAGTRTDKFEGSVIGVEVHNNGAEGNASSRSLPFGNIDLEKLFPIPSDRTFYSIEKGKAKTGNVNQGFPSKTFESSQGDKIFHPGGNGKEMGENYISKKGGYFQIIEDGSLTKSSNKSDKLKSLRTSTPNNEVDIGMKNENSGKNAFEKFGGEVNLSSIRGKGVSKFSNKEKSNEGLEISGRGMHLLPNNSKTDVTENELPNGAEGEETSPGKLGQITHRQSVETSSEETNLANKEHLEHPEIGLEIRRFGALTGDSHSTKGPEFERTTHQIELGTNIYTTEGEEKEQKMVSTRTPDELNNSGGPLLVDGKFSTPTQSTNESFHPYSQTRPIALLTTLSPEVYSPGTILPEKTQTSMKKIGSTTPFNAIEETSGEESVTSEIGLEIGKFSGIGQTNKGEPTATFEPITPRQILSGQTTTGEIDKPYKNSTSETPNDKLSSERLLTTGSTSSTPSLITDLLTTESSITSTDDVWEIDVEESTNSDLHSSIKEIVSTDAIGLEIGKITEEIPPKIAITTTLNPVSSTEEAKIAEIKTSPIPVSSTKEAKITEIKPTSILVSSTEEPKVAEIQTTPIPLSSTEEAKIVEIKTTPIPGSSTEEAKVAEIKTTPSLFSSTEESKIAKIQTTLIPVSSTEEAKIVEIKTTPIPGSSTEEAKIAEIKTTPIPLISTEQPTDLTTLITDAATPFIGQTSIFSTTNKAETPKGEQVIILETTKNVQSSTSNKIPELSTITPEFKEMTTIYSIAENSRTSPQTTESTQPTKLPDFTNSVSSKLTTPIAESTASTVLEKLTNTSELSSLSTPKPVTKEEAIITTNRFTEITTETPPNETTHVEHKELISTKSTDGQKLSNTLTSTSKMPDHFTEEKPTSTSRPELATTSAIPTTKSELILTTSTSTSTYSTELPVNVEITEPVDEYTKNEVDRFSTPKSVASNFSSSTVQLQTTLNLSNASSNTVSTLMTTQEHVNYSERTNAYTIVSSTLSPQKTFKCMRYKMVKYKRHLNNDFKLQSKKI